MIKISTWNVNSINARILHLLDYLKDEKPDIVLLQELKCTIDAFPYDEIEDLGYNIAVNGQKSYNGVAILSKYSLSDVKTTFPDNPIGDEARYIEAWVNFKKSSIMVSSVYVPNGQDVDSIKYPIKLEFLNKLTDYYKKILDSSEIVVVGGDFNIALTDEDIYDAELWKEKILFSSKEKKQLREFLATGFTDSYLMINQNKLSDRYTWWDYRSNSFNLNKGMRIDYIFCSFEAAQINTDSFVSKKWRSLPRPSDHVPVSSIFNINPS